MSLFRYVALGDSTGTGVGDQVDGGYPERLFRRLKDAGVPAGILNLAQSGATTREVVQGQVQRAVATRPALVTLGIGTNDLWRMVPVGTFEMNLKLIADQLQKCGAEVVVSNIIDLSLAPVAALVDAWLRIPLPMFQRRLAELNARIEALGRRPGFTVVDLLSFSRRELSAHPEYFCPDGFHPSPAGYDRWAELMWPAVESVAARWQAGQQTGS
ncbi:MAG TPA: SGNH/GDSL hydrolase family protein [Myxococcaceae bacterium]|nr:SGNH/GDSL hydrolase family protein [Myxococcaceae bacterium]